MKKKVKSSYILIFMFSLLFFACNRKDNQTITYDFPEILEKDTLTILTLNSSVSYFLYKDQPMGFHYELAKEFCDTHNLKIKVKTAINEKDLLNMLQNKEGDIIAYDTPIQNNLKDSILYVGIKTTAYQTLIQRSFNSDTVIKDIVELKGKIVTVTGGTKYYQRLQNLNKELGGGIEIEEIEKDSVVVEDLIRMVALGEIKYTIADSELARLSKTYFRNIDISVPISFTQQSSWATRHDMPILAEEINKWSQENSHSIFFNSTYKKYFEQSKGYWGDVVFTDIKLLDGVRISKYDDIFKEHGKSFEIDWKLLSAISYVESKFKSSSKAWTGASGLMGLMPSTARAMGTENEDILIPHINVKAGAKYIKHLEKAFNKIEDEDERIKFILASYNGGIGHVRDAQALAKKYGHDQYVWEGNVEKFILLKKLPEYYNDPVCKCGFFRGTETVNYVRSVLHRKERYESLTSKRGETE